MRILVNHVALDVDLRLPVTKLGIKMFSQKYVTLQNIIASKGRKLNIKTIQIMNLTPIFVCTIIFGCFYKIIELFARRRERMAIIEKISELTPDKADAAHISRLLNPSPDNRFGPLKLGALIMGLGLGLFTYVLISLNINTYTSYDNEILGTSLTLIGGGIGLIAAFIIEYRIRKSDKDRK